MTNYVVGIQLATELTVAVTILHNLRLLIIDGGAFTLIAFTPNDVLQLRSWTSSDCFPGLLYRSLYPICSEKVRLSCNRRL